MGIVQRGFALILTPVVFLTLMVMALIALPPAAQAADAVPVFRIADIQLNQTTGQILIRGDHKVADTYAKNFSAVKLPGPYRMVIDIPEATPPVGRATYPVNKFGIQKIDVSRQEGTFYNATRLTIYVEDAATLWKLNAAYDDNVLAIGLPGGEPVANQPTTPAALDQQVDLKSGFNIPAGRNVVAGIEYKNDILTVHGQPGAKLRIKNRFTLSDPSRLVIDLENSYVANRGLVKTITPKDPLISSIRVGQFDEETVRIVMDTASPERVQITYPGADASKLVISPYLDSTATTLPADVQLGKLDNVVVDKRDGATVVRITTSNPMVHRVMKDKDSVFVDFLNIAAQPGWVKYDPDAFPELKFLKVEPLAAGQPNAKLVVDLNNTNFEVYPTISEDGQTLELTFVQPSAMLTLNGAAAKAPYAAKIVVDAGHGGKDQGASRNGVLEKDLNLRVALMLRDALKARGLQVYMTRDTDKFVPLPEISNYANSVHPALFVSIHHNASTNPGLNGVETYYYTPQSKALADRVHRKIANNVSAPDRGVRRAMFYVIHHTAAPSILCEVGYVSNAVELQQLQTYDRQQRTVNAIADGVVEYLRSQVSANADTGH